jgi:hypothetical protein
MLDPGKDIAQRGRLGIDPVSRKIKPAPATGQIIYPIRPIRSVSARRRYVVVS